MKTSIVACVFTAYFKYSEFYMSKRNHPFPVDDLSLLWSHCEDYLTWMLLEGKILICKFFFSWHSAVLTFVLENSPPGHLFLDIVHCFQDLKGKRYHLVNVYIL